MSRLTEIQINESSINEGQMYMKDESCQITIFLSYVFVVRGNKYAALDNWNL